MAETGAAGAVDVAAIRDREENARGLLTHHERNVEFYADRCAVDSERWPCDPASVRDSAADVPVLLAAYQEEHARADRLWREKEDLLKALRDLRDHAHCAKVRFITREALGSGGSKAASDG